MSQISYTNLVDGDVPTASGFNSRFLQAINLLNSGVEPDNIATNAVTTVKIASEAVTSAKLAHPILLKKGADIASATTTDLSTATGECVDITGTTTITGLGTVQSGSVFYLRFTGILLLTYNATSLIIPTSADITTQAGDVAAFQSLGSGNWVCISYLRKDGTSVGAASTGNSVQIVNTQTGSVSTGTTAIPYDDSIPQNTEGDEYITLAITPTNASNKLKIEVNVMGNHGTDSHWSAALFQDSTANALRASTTYAGAGNGGSISFTYFMTAGTTSATTFKVRAGGASGATFTFNGTGGNRRFGGVAASSITITEIKV